MFKMGKYDNLNVFIGYISNFELELGIYDII